MGRRAGEHVYGPYKRVGKRGGITWRVVTKSGRDQAVVSFPSEAEAVKAVQEAKQRLKGRTVDEAVTAYLRYLEVDKGRPEITIATLRNSIGRLVLKHRNDPLLDLTPKKARAAYRSIATSGEFKPDTHQNSLRDARSAWKWMAKLGWVPRNPWEEIEPIGERTKGKTQLRRDEAAALMELCIPRLDEDGAVATLLCLLLAVRISEVTALRGRDIDAGGSLLWVERGKTKNAKRSLEVPEPLQAVMAARAKAAGKLGRLFPYTRNWVSYWCRVLCAGAGVTVVAGHALRGTHATLATLAGATSHAVAAALGHGSTAVTEAHYTKASATAAATQKRALSAVTGNKAAVSSPRKTRKPKA